MIDVAAQTAIVAQLKPCGISVRDIAMHFDEELRFTIVTIRRSAKVDASKFICIRHALWAKADVEFEDERTLELYRAFDSELGRAEGRAIARAWLHQRGLPEQLPRFDVGEPAASVVAKIEQYCGIKPGTAFEHRFPGYVSVRRELLTFPVRPEAECLFQVLAAVDTDHLDFKIGFIGNGAAVEEKTK